MEKSAIKFIAIWMKKKPEKKSMELQSFELIFLLLNN